MYKVDIIKKCDIDALLTISTPIYGEGLRLPGLKRNLENMDIQNFKSWKQVIIVDHSPKEVVDILIDMVAKTKYPDKREILWMTGDKPTGEWGRISHNEVWKKCNTKYIAFHCDDNVVSMNNYRALVGVMEDMPTLDFLWASAVNANWSMNKMYHIYQDFSLTNIDWGCPVIRMESFRRLMPKGLVDEQVKSCYAFDWEVFKLLALRRMKFAHWPFIGYYWCNGVADRALDRQLVDWGDAPTPRGDLSGRKYPGWTQVPQDLVDKWAVQTNRCHVAEIRDFLDRYNVVPIKPFQLSNPPKILIGTTTHDKGQRLPLLKRNIDNLNLQKYQDWGQVIMIDHSPQDVVNKIVQMVKNSEHPERRAIYWMWGGYQTGSWGKVAHQEILNTAQGNEYYAFHSDDNFMSRNHLSSLMGLFNHIPNLDFAYSHTIRLRNHDQESLMEGFACGQFDLGAPLLKMDKFKQIIPHLSLIKSVYVWDWLMVEALVSGGATFTCSGLPTYIWAQFWKCNQERWEKEQSNPNKKFFPEIAKKYPGFRAW